MKNVKNTFSIIAIAAAIGLSACGGGGGAGGGSGGSNAPAAPSVPVAPAVPVVSTYSVGGTVTGLTSGTVTLLNNGGDSHLAANGAFNFSTALAAGAKYAVTIGTKPTGQTCSITNGTGTITGNVTNVAVSCFDIILHAFGSPGTTNDGANPVTNLVTDASGNIYGRTFSGGGNLVGTVFKITSAGVESVLYDFATAIPNGTRKPRSLAIDTNGNLYGAIANAGVYGTGAAFKITPSGVESVLYSFGATAGDGTNPDYVLAPDINGNVYGTTYSGGTNNLGTVFKITSAGVESVLHSFVGGADGANPTGLVLDTSGSFYGITDGGGAGNLGTVFTITPAGTESTLHSFSGGTADGASPSADLIIDASGNVYGTTKVGGTGNLGTVFKITAAGVESVLHSFSGGADGANPYAGLAIDAGGNLYGTTYIGGVSNLGTVFKLTAAGAESVLYSFSGGYADGANPYAKPMLDANGNIYGTTFYGGAPGEGTVFKLAQ